MISPIPGGKLTLVHYGHSEARKWSFIIGRSDIRIVPTLADLDTAFATYGSLVQRVIVDAPVDAAEFLTVISSVAAHLDGDIVLLQKGRGYISASNGSGPRLFYSLAEDDVTFYLNCHGLLPLEGTRLHVRAAELPLATILPPVGCADEHGMIALIADDEPRCREEAAAIFRALGYSVVLAKTGLQALRLADTLKPAIVVLDGLMPEMPGFEAARFLHMQARDSRPFVMMMTAIYKNTRYRNEAKLKYGIDAYVVKPLTPGDIVNAIAPVERGRMRLAIPA
jgi:CheY-like chemotaxis protein